MSKNITIPVPAVPFAPPVYTCHRAKKEFHLDGNINKPFWEDAPYTDEFLDTTLMLEDGARSVPCVLSTAQKCSGMMKIFTLLPTLPAMKSGVI